MTWRIAGRCQLPVRPPHRHEHRPRTALRTSLRQPAGDCLAGRRRQREPLGAAALARHRDLPGPPLDVLQLQARGFRATQPEAGQQRQDRVITQSDRCPAIAAGQQPLDIGRGQSPRQRASRHDATAGTAPASGTSVRPVACANRRNARSDVTIAFADQELRSRE